MEFTENLSKLGLTPKEIQRWQQEDDPEDEPGPFLMPEDIRTLEQRRAEQAASQQPGNGAKGGRNGHRERTASPPAAPGEVPAQR